MGLGNWGRRWYPTRFPPSHWGGGIGTPLGDSPLIGGDGTPLGDPLLTSEGSDTPLDDSLLPREGKVSPLKMLPSLLGIASASEKSAKSEAANSYIYWSRNSLF